MKLYNIEWENVTPDHDYWCDTYISYAEHEDGTPLTDEELESMDSDVICEYLIEDMPWL